MLAEDAYVFLPPLEFQGGKGGLISISQILGRVFGMYNVRRRCVLISRHPLITEEG